MAYYFNLLALLAYTLMNLGYSDAAFTIVQSPPSLSFDDRHPIPSESLGQIILTSLGFHKENDISWPGVKVENPFGLAKRAVVIFVDQTPGVSFKNPVANFGLDGDGAQFSVYSLLPYLKNRGISTADINLQDALRSPNGKNEIDEALNLISSGASKDSHLQTSDCGVDSSLVVINLTQEPSDEAVAEKSEVKHLIDHVVSRFSECKDSSLIAVVSEKNIHPRLKRETSDSTTEFNPMNLAVYYSQDYPVIFNIVLWFMVLLTLSLLAISYSIATMDPGRDSIIYRMTSTRIKKDN